MPSGPPDPFVCPHPPCSYAPSAVVQHEYDYSLAGLFRQFAKYGAQEPHMCATHPEYAAWLHASADIPARPLLTAAALPHVPQQVTRKL